MKVVKSLWNTLNGRKTWLGILLAVVYSGLVTQGIIARDATVEAIIFAVTGVGVGHKLVKS